MSGKYQPLADYLAGLPAEQATVELTFEEVARLVGELPPSARTTRTWWGNSSHTQALAWRAAGWHVAAVEMSGRRVRFARGRVGGSRADGVGAPRRHTTISTSQPIRQTNGRSAEDVPVLGGHAHPVENVQVTVRFAWQRLGPVALDKTGKVMFPRPLPSVPGLYRMLFTGNGAQRWYIGETDNLRRRLGSNYRNPGPSQQTSLRVNAALLTHLDAGGEVLVDVALSAEAAAPDAAPVSLDLTRKAGRLLAESAAVVLAQRAGHDLENLG